MVLFGAHEANGGSGTLRQGGAFLDEAEEAQTGAVEQGRRGLWSLGEHGTPAGAPVDGHVIDGRLHCQPELAHHLGFEALARHHKR